MAYQEEETLHEKVVHINRTAKVVKGGKRFSFAALVVVGDGNGQVGFGNGKAREVPEAIRKGIEKAKASMVEVPLINGTIPYEVLGSWGAGRVVIKPAREGRGVIAGGAVRAVMEAAGIRNVVSKVTNGGSHANTLRATIEGLKSLRHPDDIRRSRQSPGEEI
ncbi:MAG: 30S ribosomal protein S5 [Nitrospirota bacterium]|nr:30S ribosomal protein S5 [Nitrospirota bacterium]